MNKLNLLLLLLFTTSLIYIHPFCYGEELTTAYKTDFSQADDRFSVHDPLHRPLWEIKNGVLHLKGKQPGGNCTVLYGSQSRTSFLLKLSEENPSAHITVLWDPHRNCGHTVIISDKQIHEYSTVDGKEVYSRFTSHSLKPNVWYQVEIEIQNRYYHLTIGRHKVLSSRLHRSLPQNGYLFLLAINTEYWVDDLEIQLPRNEVAEMAASPTAPYPVSDDWTIQTVVPPAPITTAPFDIVVDESGRILVEGPRRKTLVSVSPNGEINTTGIPVDGHYFDISNDNRIWYYGSADGNVSVTSEKDKKITPLFTIPPTHFPGSISVSEDGSMLYITRADDTLSYIFRYAKGELNQIACEPHDGPYAWVFASVEKTKTGTVWVAGVRGIYFIENDRVKKMMSLSEFYPLSTTSDDAGNLYVAAFYKDERGIYKITPDKTLKKYSNLPGPQDGPAQVGIFWDKRRQAIVAVHKEAHQIYIITSGNIKPLLDTNFLSTPIALAPDKDGGVYVNGDELGLQYVDSRGNVEVLTKGLVSFQPPAADIALIGNTLFYTGGAPGFPSFIYEINTTGKIISKNPVNGIPGGIEIDGKGNVFFADYGDGKIKTFNPGMKSGIIANGLKYPVGLAIDRNGTFYVSTSDEDALIDPHLVEEVLRRRIMKIGKTSRVEEFFKFDTGDITFFDIDRNGTLFIPVGEAVYSLDQDKNLKMLARGFIQARDAKFAGDGSLYVVDTGNSSLYRLIPK